MVFQQWHRYPRQSLSALEYPRDLPLFPPYICTWLIYGDGSWKCLILGKWGCGN